jgi:hypothetical protein
MRHDTKLQVKLQRLAQESAAARLIQSILKHALLIDSHI